MLYRLSLNVEEFGDEIDRFDLGNLIGKFISKFDEIGEESSG